MKRLIAKRLKIYKQLPRSTEVIRGTLVVMNRVCGHSNCRCAKGNKHQSLYLSQSQKGKTRMIYIPKHAEDRFRQAVQRYQSIKKGLNQLSEINIDMIKGHSGGEKK